MTRIRSNPNKSTESSGEAKSSSTASPSAIGQGGDATFTIDGGSPNQFRRPITVRYSMSGTASLGSDYTLSGTPGQVTISEGETSATVTLHASVTGSNKKKRATLALEREAAYKLGHPKRTSLTIRP